MDKIKTNFMGQTIYVGMDIHKASWNLGIHLNDQSNPAIYLVG